MFRRPFEYVQTNSVSLFWRKIMLQVGFNSTKNGKPRRKPRPKRRPKPATWIRPLPDPSGKQGFCVRLRVGSWMYRVVCRTWWSSDWIIEWKRKGTPIAVKIQVGMIIDRSLLLHSMRFLRPSEWCLHQSRDYARKRACFCFSFKSSASCLNFLRKTEMAVCNSSSLSGSNSRQSSASIPCWAKACLRRSVP